MRFVRDNNFKMHFHYGVIENCIRRRRIYTPHITDYGTRPNITLFVIHATAPILWMKNYVFHYNMQNEVLKLESHRRAM